MVKDIKFGITERGDIAFDNRWIYYVSTGQVQGAILISKGLPGKLGLTNMVKFKDKIIFHATTTGWGGTEIEPNVDDYETRLEKLINFVSESEFPMDHIVVRVDPIIPTEEGFSRAKDYARFSQVDFENIASIKVHEKLNCIKCDVTIYWNSNK